VALAALTGGRSVVQEAGRRAVEGQGIPRTLDHTALAFRLS
jgi:hypothetical protein